jgi:hypothetical protein
MVPQSLGVMPVVAQLRAQRPSPVDMDLQLDDNVTPPPRKRPADDIETEDDPQRTADDNPEEAMLVEDAPPTSAKKRRGRNSRVHSGSKQTTGIKQFDECDRDVIIIATELMKLEIVTSNPFPNETQIRQMVVKSWKSAHIRREAAAASTTKDKSSGIKVAAVVPPVPDHVYNYVRPS